MHLRVKDLKNLVDNDLLEDYYRLALTQSPNINTSLFNSYNYSTISSLLYREKITHKFLKFLLLNNVINTNCVRYLTPLTSEDALNIFKEYPSDAFYNEKILKLIDRESFKTYFFNKNINELNFHTIYLALLTYIIDGNKFYKILDSNNDLKKKIFDWYNPPGGYASKAISSSLNINIFKNFQLNDVKIVINNFVDTTLLRDNYDELKFLRSLLFSSNFSVLYYNNPNYFKNDTYNIDKNLLDLTYRHISIFKNGLENIKKEEHYYYNDIFKYLSLSDKFTYIEKIVSDMDIEFIKQFFDYSTSYIYRLIKWAISNTDSINKIIVETHFLKKIVERRELLEVLIKATENSINLLLILNKDIFNMIKDDHDLLKKMFVYNNKAHYILSRIYKDHPLSKSNYNSEACYGNIWQDECSNCLFYSERNLNLETRCARKFTSIYELALDGTITKNFQRHDIENRAPNKFLFNNN